MNVKRNYHFPSISKWNIDYEHIPISSTTIIFDHVTLSLSNTKLHTLFCLFAFFLVFVPFENFSLIWRGHHYQWRAAKFWPMLGTHGHPAVREGFFLYMCTITTYCDTEHLFISVISEDPWHSHLLSSVGSGTVTTCFYDLGLSPLGFEHPTFFHARRTL